MAVAKSIYRCMIEDGDNEVEFFDDGRYVINKNYLKARYWKIEDDRLFVALGDDKSWYHVFAPDQQYIVENLIYKLFEHNFHSALEEKLDKS